MYSAKSVGSVSAGLSGLLNAYANLIGYINLYPGGDTDEYRQYVQDYIDDCHPTYLSFDQYPFASGGSTFAYMDTLKVIREKAIANHIPFTGCVGTSTSSYSQEPNTEVNEITQAQLNWKVNTLLAYGAKGYTWFTLVQPRSFALVGDEEGTTGMDYDRAGLIGADGSKTLVYDKAKLINKWVSKIDSILMDLESVGIIAAGNDAQYITGYSSKTYGNVTLSVGDALADKVKCGVIAGVFDYHGKMAYYIVNHDLENNQDFSITLETAGNLTIYEQPTELTAEVTAQKVTNVTTQDLTLAPGAAVLVIED